MSNTLNFEEFADLMKNNVNQVCDGFTDPEDDFVPVMQLLPQEGTGIILGFDGAFLATEESKDKLANHVMRPAISGFGAKQMAWIMSAWMVKYDTTEGDPRDEDGFIEGPKPSEHPDRIETVILTVMDSTNVAVFLAEINRDGKNPPTLSEWERMPNGEEMSGRFYTGMQDALRDSSGKANPEFLAQIGMTE